MFVDSHCHLDYFDSNEVDEIFSICKEKKVSVLQNVCVDLSKVEQVVSFASKYNNVKCSLGMHPCNILNKSITIEDLQKKYIKYSKYINSIGETGLDYSRGENLDIKNLQKESFINHIEFAREIDKVVIIHTRDAEEDLIDICKTLSAKRSFKAVLHCFTGSKELMFKMLDYGFSISISGIATFKNASDLRDIIKEIPKDRLLLETDSPYLAPHPFRGKKNKPYFIPIIAECIAGILNLDLEEIGNITSANYFNLFSS